MVMSVRLITPVTYHICVKDNLSCPITSLAAERVVVISEQLRLAARFHVPVLRPRHKA